MNTKTLMFSIYIAIAALFVGAFTAFAYDASDLVGQTDGFGNPVFTTSISTTTDSGLATPAGVDIDSSQNRLFVADTANDRVLVFDLNTDNEIDDRTADYVLGQFVFTSNNGGIPNLSNVGLFQPVDVDYDEVNRRLFVADAGHSRVMVYDLSGGITNGMAASWVIGVQDFISYNPATAQNRLSHPISVSYNEADELLFVADGGSHYRTMIFDLSSGITNGMNAMNVLGALDFVTPAYFPSLSDIAEDSTGVFYDEANDRVFTADAPSGRVKIYDTTSGITNGMGATNVLGRPDFTTPFLPTPAPSQDLMQYPSGLIYDYAHDRLFVADEFSHRVLMYNTSSITNGMNSTSVLGQSTFTTGTNGTSINTLSLPYHMAMDNSGHHLFIADMMNSRILEYNFVELYGSLPNATTGSSYTETLPLRYDQGTVTYAHVAGTLPPGLSLVGGQITGTPTTAGTYVFTIEATDTFSASQVFVDTYEYSITVNTPGPKVKIIGEIKEVKDEPGIIHEEEQIKRDNNPSDRRERWSRIKKQIRSRK